VQSIVDRGDTAGDAAVASSNSTSACSKNGFFAGVSRSCSARRSGGTQ
jgi:hypothetical protein